MHDLATVFTNNWAGVFLGFGIGSMVMSLLYTGMLTRSGQWLKEAEAERKDAHDRLMALYDENKKDHEARMAGYAQRAKDISIRGGRYEY